MTTLTSPEASLRGRGADRTTTEIFQQPGLWRQLPDCVPASLVTEIAAVLDRPALRVVLAGAGTSAFAGLVLAPRLRQLRQRRVDAVATTDIVSAPHDAFAEDVPTLLVSFARSGDSPESVAAVELADQLLTDVHHLAVTCNAEGRLATEFAARPDAHVVLLPAEADDAGFAMTSSFTGMVLAGLLAFGDEQVAQNIDVLADAVERVLPAWVGDTAAMTGHSRIVYLGSGSLAGLARESALKVLELTAGHRIALSDSSLGFRHGPKAFLDDDTLAIVYVSTDPYTRRYDLDILRELRSTLRPEDVLAISAGAQDLPDDGPAWLLPDLAGMGDAAFGVGAVVAAQLVALQNSLALGLTPDNPFPGGQVNRVVQGVTIHPLDR